MFKNFFPENLAVYYLMQKNIVEPDRLQMTIWRMRFACWTTKAANTLRTYNTVSPTAITVTRMRLGVKYYVQCLYC